MFIHVSSLCQIKRDMKDSLHNQIYFFSKHTMKEGMKLKHFEEYMKLSTYNLIIDLDGLLDIQKSNTNKIILSDKTDKACETSFLHYVEQKINIARVILHQKLIKTS